MKKTNKILTGISIILIIALEVVTYLYFNMRETAQNNLNELLQDAEQYSEQLSELNEKIENLKEQIESNTNSTSSYISSGMTVANPNDNTGIQASELESNRSPENVTIEVVGSAITKESAEILITDQNEVSYAWGEEFRMQKKVNGEWQEMQTISDNLIFNAIAYQLNENKQLNMKVNYGQYYGALENGIYRIIKPVYDQEYIDLYSNEFEIK